MAGAKEGVFVEQVTAGGPSEKAGMKEGDVIVAINGKPVHDGNQLIGTVTATPLGNALNITVDREGKRHDLKVVVADLAQIFPERYGNGRENPLKNEEPTAVSFGMQIQNLTDQQADRLGVKQKGGVQVVSVEPNSFAEDIGLAARRRHRFDQPSSREHDRRHLQDPHRPACQATRCSSK